jgi:subtilisin family serine protease
MSKLLLFGIWIISFSSSAFAAPANFDEPVRKFLASPTAETLSVLVSYRRGVTAAFSEQVMILEASARQSAIFNGPLFAASIRPQLAWIANGTFATLTQTQVQALSQDSRVRSITYAGEVARLVPEIAGPLASSSPTWGLEKINIPATLLLAPGLDGHGVKIGILDTGIDDNHPELHGKTILYKDFVDPSITTPRDDQGHGTHVSGTIAGSAAIGVAPGASLIVGKAFDSNGACKTKDLILALQWMADPDGNPATADFPLVLANSWEVGGKYGERDPADEPLCVVVENLSRLGITSVFAAGNMGYAVGSVQLPSACPAAFSVGATDQTDQIAVFSSRGPARWKSVKLAKPEVSAPGVDVISADPGGGYKTRSGTSMAAPHVAGAFALLLQAKPGISVADLKAAMIGGAVDLGAPGPDGDFGAGRVDLLRSWKLLGM